MFVDSRAIQHALWKLSLEILFDMFYLCYVELVSFWFLPCLLILGIMHSNMCMQLSVIVYIRKLYKIEKESLIDIKR